MTIWWRIDLSKGVSEHWETIARTEYVTNVVEVLIDQGLRPQKARAMAYRAERGNGSAFTTTKSGAALVVRCARIEEEKQYEEQ